MLEERGVTERTPVTVGMEDGEAVRMNVDVEETVARPPGKTDSPSERKGSITFYLSSRCVAQSTTVHIKKAEIKPFTEAGESLLSCHCRQEEPPSWL